MRPRLVGLAVALSAAVVAAQVDVTTIGPRVGQRAIDFRLTDQNGRPQTLASLRGSNGTMLVFFRSADW